MVNHITLQLKGVVHLFNRFWFSCFTNHDASKGDRKLYSYVGKTLLEPGFKRDCKTKLNVRIK